MKYLSELLKIVSKKALLKNDLLEGHQLDDQNNLYAKFYKGLKNGNLNSDQDAAMLLYGNKNNDEKYRKLKSRFYKKLTNNLLLISYKNFNLPPSYLAEVKTKRYISLASFLKNIGATENAIRLGRKALLLAEKSHSYQNIISVSSLLAILYTEKNLFKESELMNKKLRQANKSLSYESTIIQQYQQLNYSLKYEYPFSEKSANTQIIKTDKFEEKKFSNETTKLLTINQIIRFCLKGHFTTVIECCDTYLSDIKISNLNNEDLFLIIYYKFLAQCLTLSSSELMLIFEQHLNNPRFDYKQKEKVALTLITALINQNQVEKAIKVFNKLIQDTERELAKKSGVKLEIYYYYLQYFRIKFNILNPINRIRKLPQINGIEDFSNLKIRSTDFIKSQNLQIAILDLLSIRNRFQMSIKLEQIRKLQGGEALKSSKRAIMFFKIINHWERHDFGELPESIHKEFNFLCSSNFLNSQNLDTFEPVNYGTLLKMIFENQSISVPEFN